MIGGASIFGAGPILGVGAMKAIEWSFLISGGLTVAYMTKLFICIFIEKNIDAEKQAKFDSMKKYMNPVSAAALTVSACALPILGFAAPVLMNKIADLGQGFMQFSGEVEAVRYYSFGNLKGGLTSIIIGVLIYVLVVRTVLMKKEEVSGSQIRYYADRWPKWLDIEDSLYRPILLGILPFVGGVFSRICDSLVDFVAVLISKTLLKDSPLPYELDEGTAFTHMLGVCGNRIQSIRNALFRRRKEPLTVDYEHKFAVIRGKYRENMALISRSMSFGLLLFCIGLLVTLIYLVLRRGF